MRAVDRYEPLLVEPVFAHQLRRQGGDGVGSGDDKAAAEAANRATSTFLANMAREIHSPKDAFQGKPFDEAKLFETIKELAGVDWKREGRKPESGVWLSRPVARPASRTAPKASPDHPPGRRRCGSLECKVAARHRPEQSQTLQAGLAIVAFGQGLGR